MPLIQTADLHPSGSGLDPETQHQVYCGLDSALTVEILDAMKRDHAKQPCPCPETRCELHGYLDRDKFCRTIDGPPPHERIYAFERALQAPLLEISLRGFRIDQLERHRAALAIERDLLATRECLDEMAQAVWSAGLNPASHKQLKEFFYERLRMPEQWIHRKSEKFLSCNREALEKLDDYIYARPFTQTILAARDLAKQHKFLTAEVDPDGRYRTSYNIGGTETGRLSSSTSPLGTGGNAQNIPPRLRRVFIADPGWKLGHIDEEQAEARDVGFLCGCLFGDWSLLDACESGDLHTTNCRLIWPELPWTGDLPRDKSAAERKFYRDFSYRDMSKRGGHATNYLATAWTMSRHLKIPQKLAEEFQARYCKGGRDTQGREIIPAYPVLPRYWQWIAQELQTKGYLQTPFGRKRDFFGHRSDDATLREGIAFPSQSMTGERTNLWLWRVWRYEPRVQLLAQTHDSITFQYPEDSDEDSIIRSALEHLRIPLVDERSGRVYIVPGEAKVGWNWASESTSNPDGLRKWKPGVRDSRKRQSAEERLAS